MGLAGKRAAGLSSAAVGAWVAAALTLAACGDSDKSDESSTTRSEPVGEVTTIGSFTEGGSDAAPEGSLEAKAGEGQPQKESLQVAPGARVNVTATISNAGEKPEVSLLIPNGPSTELALELGPLDGDPVSTLTLRSTGGPVKVGQIRYICSLPPNTFCPVQFVVSKDASTLRMVPGEDGRVKVRFTLRSEKASTEKATKKPPGSQEKAPAAKGSSS